jgi:hypothetical protein
VRVARGQAGPLRGDLHGDLRPRAGDIRAAGRVDPRTDAAQLDLPDQRRRLRPGGKRGDPLFEVWCPEHIQASTPTWSASWRWSRPAAATSRSTTRTIAGAPRSSSAELLRPGFVGGDFLEGVGGDDLLDTLSLRRETEPCEQPAERRLVVGAELLVAELVAKLGVVAVEGPAHNVDVAGPLAAILAQPVEPLSCAAECGAAAAAGKPPRVGGFPAAKARRPAPRSRQDSIRSIGSKRVPVSAASTSAQFSTVCCRGIVRSFSNQERSGRGSSPRNSCSSAKTAWLSRSS